MSKEIANPDGRAYETPLGTQVVFMPYEVDERSEFSESLSDAEHPVEVMEGYWRLTGFDHGEAAAGITRQFNSAIGARDGSYDGLAAYSGTTEDGKASGVHIACRTGEDPYVRQTRLAALVWDVNTRLREVQSPFYLTLG